MLPASAPAEPASKPEEPVAVAGATEDDKLKEAIARTQAEQREAIALIEAEQRAREHLMKTILGWHHHLIGWWGAFGRKGEKHCTGGVHWNFEAGMLKHVIDTNSVDVNVGLLGGSFFNNYKYSVDIAAGVITLVPNERVRGGAAAEQWRERFYDLRTSIERLEGYLDDRMITRPNRRRNLEMNLEALKEDLGNLEIEANYAGVPKSWRE